MKRTWLTMLLVIFMCMSSITVLANESEMPDQVLKPRVVDGDSLLTDKEEAQLLGYLDDISERQQCDVVLVTTDSFEGKKAGDFAEDYFKSNGFGMGSESDGIVFVVSMSERKRAFSTFGFGADVFTDETLKRMEKTIESYLNKKDYYGAFLTYADEADAALGYARELEHTYVDGEEYSLYAPDTKQSGIVKVIKRILILIPFSAVIGTVLAFFMKLRAQKKYSGKIRNKKSMTKSYVSQIHLTKDEVQLMGDGINRRHSPRQKRNTNRSRKSRVKRSSSRRSHGGRSRKK